ncbi:MAG: hypothetical protein ACK5M7_21715, partial [Draconibacterium sp.]
SHYYAITQLITIQKTSKNQIAYKFTSGRLKQEAALLGQPLINLKSFLQNPPPLFLSHHTSGQNS